MGHFLNSSTETCTPCPKGTYQDVEQRDTSCQSCPPNSTTSGLGAASVEACSNPCLIKDRLQLCPVNSQCEAPSIGSEDFRCVCKEGFKEASSPASFYEDPQSGNSISSDVSAQPNSPMCVDICDDYCINGGKCHWQSGKCLSFIYILIFANFFKINRNEKTSLRVLDQLLRRSLRAQV